MSAKAALQIEHGLPAPRVAPHASRLCEIRLQGASPAPRGDAPEQLTVALYGQTPWGLHPSSATHRQLDLGQSDRSKPPFFNPQVQGLRGPSGMKSVAVSAQCLAHRGCSGDLSYHFGQGEDGGPY